MIKKKIEIFNVQRNKKGACLILRLGVQKYATRTLLVSHQPIMQQQPGK